MSNAITDPPFAWHELLRVDPASITEEVRRDLDRVWRLAGIEHPTEDRLACSVALLAQALGALEPFNPVSLPFGYEHFDLNYRHTGWVLRDDLHRVAIQILGFANPDETAITTAMRVDAACDHAVHAGLVESQRHDRWRPGMASGSGWTTAYRATVYGAEYSRRACVRPNGFQPGRPTQTQSAPHENSTAGRDRGASSDAAMPSHAAPAPEPGGRAGAVCPPPEARTSSGIDAEQRTPPIGDSAAAKPASVKPSKAQARPESRGQNAEANEWLTVTESARRLIAEDVIDNLNLPRAKAHVSTAATRGRLLTNGEQGRARRIESGSLAKWILERRKANLAKEDDVVA